MKWLLSSLVVLVVITSIQVTTSAATVNYAIVVGNNAPPQEESSEPLRPLRYADDDAVRYHQLFSHLGTSKLLAVLDQTTQRRYPGLASNAEPATLDRLRGVVQAYAASMKRDKLQGNKSVLYFVFSGHGALNKDGEAFLAMEDGALTQEVLFEEVVAKLPTVYTHLILDACNAGGVVGVRGGFFDRETQGQTTSVSTNEVLTVLESRRLARFPHVGVLVATTLGQQAHEWSEIESGVFSHELLSGLLGPADVNGDRKIEYTEVQAFVAAANRGIRDPRAIPQVVAYAPRLNQNAPLVSWPQRSAARVVQGEFGRLGHFYIELENGQRYLDAHLDANSKASVFVLASDGVFLRTNDHEVRLPEAPLVATRELSFTPRKTDTRGSIATSYRTALFSSAYGRTYYQGYVDSLGAVGVQFSDSFSSRQGPRHPRGEGGWQGNKVLAVGALSVAGVSAIGTVFASVLVYQAKRDFADTDLQRPAYSAKERYERYRKISIATGATALVSGVAAWWLWPRETMTLVPTASEGAYSLSLVGSW